MNRREAIRRDDFVGVFLDSSTIASAQWFVQRRAAVIEPRDLDGLHSGEGAYNGNLSRSSGELARDILVSQLMSATSTHEGHYPVTEQFNPKNPLRR